jgi:hypothetical protein
MASEIQKPGIYKKVFPFKTAHLKPSMTPTIGLMEYNSRSFTGTTELLNPTGEM